MLLYVCCCSVELNAARSNLPDVAFTLRVHSRVFRTIEFTSERVRVGQRSNQSKLSCGTGGKTRLTARTMARRNSPPLPHTLYVPGECGSFSSCRCMASGVATPHHTCAKPMKKSCLLVRLTAGNGSSRRCVSSHSSYAFVSSARKNCTTSIFLLVRLCMCAFGAKHACSRKCN